VTVRRATPADARDIALVHVCTWQAAYRHVFPAEVLDALSVDAREGEWREILERSPGPVWVAEDDSRIVGFAGAGASRIEEDVAELYAIYVLPSAWGSGAGHELMHAVLDWFIAEEYTTAMLWVLDDNPRARRFYEREGWRRDGDRVETVRGVEVLEALYRLTLAGA
jgi:RimJ/RimL family protein N-acetyltransferase